MGVNRDDPMNTLPALSLIEGAYLRDLLAQPQALADTLAGLRAAPSWEVRAANYAKIVLTGMGSSLHALHPLQLRLVRAGHTAMMVETAELIHAQADLLDDRTLLVVVSQSGRSVEIVQLLERLAAREKRPFVIGVTNTRGLAAGLVRRCGRVDARGAGVFRLLQDLPGHPGRPGVAGGRALRRGSGGPSSASWSRPRRRLRAIWPSGAGTCKQLVGELRGVRDLFITGRGASLAAAGTGGLIVKESTHVPAEGMSCPAFRHGPFEMVSAEVFVLVFAGDPATAALNAALVRDVRAAGGRAALVGDAEEPGVFRLPAVPACVRPVVEMLPVQMVSLALGALAGREPGRFERGSKVTTIA